MRVFDVSAFSDGEYCLLYWDVALCSCGEYCLLYWDVTLCSDGKYHHSGGTFCLYFVY